MDHASPSSSSSPSSASSAPLRTSLSRRQWLTAGSLASLAMVLAKPGQAAAPDPQQNTAVPAFLGHSPLTLPPLPFADDALEPVISAKTIGIHYGKHHRAYFDNLQKLVAGTPMSSASLEELIMASHGKAEMEAIFNNAGQAWNHNFYWNSLSPVKTAPDARLQAAIVRKFGSMDALVKALVATSASQFGSGWGWLAADAGELVIVKTGNADTPFTRGLAPLLTVDVWEHAYYLDYQNRRPDYLNATVSQHLNWTFASANFARV
jgi:Fe-Mn family superoxide dismutase